MAASITGTFTIIDRASGPMRKMESQAIKTMAAIEAVGLAEDKTAGKHQAAGRKMEQTARSMKTVDNAAKETERSTRGLNREMDSAGRSSRNAERGFAAVAGKLGQVNQVFRFFTSILGAMKLPALGAGIVALAQAIGVLAGGVTALLPGLGQAGMAIGALPQTIMAAVQGFGVFKLAMGGVAEALKAGIQLQQQNAQATAQAAEAHIQAVHGVQEAEYGLMTSQRQVTQAQVALTEARREAVRNLQDLVLASLSADLSQKRSVLSLREARQELANAAINPQTTDLQMQSLQLNVQESSLGVRQANLAQARSHEDLHRAQRRGVGGNLQVIAASNALTDAIHGQKDAVFQLAEAQRQLAMEQKFGTGVIASFRQAMANLSPPAQAFVQKLLAMRPALASLRASAAGGLFPGLSRSLDNISRAFPMMDRLAARTGRVMGSTADRMTQRFTTPGRLKDLEALGNMNATIIGRMGNGVSNLGAALLDFMRAAQPFTNWLTRTIELGTRHIAIWSRNRRESGAWAAQLDRTKSRLQQFWQIAKDLGATLMNVFKAATPLGNRLWAGIAQGALNMRNWTSSASGMSTMQNWFNRLYAPLHALGQLTKDLLIAWAHITVNPSFTRAIQALDRYVPQVERLFNTGSNLGPQFVDVLGRILQLFNDLPISPLVLLMKAIDGVLRGIDWLVRKVPFAKYALEGLLVAGLIAKSIKMVTSLFNKWRDLFLLWETAPSAPMGPGGGLPGRAGKVATAAEEDATLAAMGGGPAAKAEGGLFARLTGGRLAGFGSKFAGFGSKLFRGGLIGSGIALGGGLLGGAIGGGVGHTVSGAATGAGIGATAGSIIPGLGTVAGGLIGGGIGALLSIGGKSDAQKNLSDFSNRVGGLSSQMQKAGDWKGLQDLANRADALAQQSPKAAAGLHQLANGLRDTSKQMAVAEQTAFATAAITNWERQIRRAHGITPRVVVDITNTLRHLSPNARTQMVGMLKTMINQMVAAHEITKQQAHALVHLINAEVSSIDKHAKAQMKLFVKTLVGGLSAAFPVVGAFTSLFEGMWKSLGGGKKFKSPLDLFKALAAGTPESQQLNIQRHLDNFFHQRGPHAPAPHNSRGPSGPGGHPWRAWHPGQVPGPRGRAAGGLVPGEGGADTVPLNATPGEFVVRAPAVRRVGVARLHAINAHGHDPLGNATDEQARSVRRKLKHMKDDSGNVLDDATQDWGNRMKRGLKRNVQKTVDDTHDNVVSSWHDVHKKVNTVHDGLLSDSKASWNKIQDTISVSSKKAYTDTGVEFDAIRAKAIKVLMSMGYSRSDANGFITSGKASKGARGLRIPGAGTADNVPIYAHGGGLAAWAAPGELIANRHTENRIDGMLASFGTSLGREVAGESKPHSAPAFAAGGRVPSFAHGGNVNTGGYVFPFPKGAKVNWSRVDQGQDIEGPAGGNVVAIGPGNVTVAPPNPTGFGSHYPLLQLSAGPWAGKTVYYGHTWVRHKGHIGAGQVIAQTGFGTGNAEWQGNGKGIPGHLEIGFWPPGSMSSGSAIAPMIRALAGHAVAGGIGSFALKHLPLSPVGGVPGTMENRMIARYVGALTDHVNKKIGSADGSGGNYHGPLNKTFGVNDPTTLSSGQVKQLAKSAGFSGAMIDLMDHVAFAESNRQPGQVNSIGATGLTQILVSAHPDAGGSAAMRNPWKNMQYAHHLFQSAGNKLTDWEASRNAGAGGGWGKFAPPGMAMGGRVGWGGWHARGGQFTVDRPTLFGAGEAGREHVTISRDGNTGRRAVQVHIGKIEYHRKGDVKKAVQAEIEALSGDLDLVGFEGD